MHIRYQTKCRSPAARPVDAGPGDDLAKGFLTRSVTFGSVSFALATASRWEHPCNSPTRAISNRTPWSPRSGRKRPPPRCPTIEILPRTTSCSMSISCGDPCAFVVQAVQRHRTTAVATFVLVFGAIATIASLWPKTYEVDGRLLMQRNELMASLVNPGRTIPREAESPTAGGPGDRARARQHPGRDEGHESPRGVGARAAPAPAIQGLAVRAVWFGADGGRSHRRAGRPDRGVGCRWARATRVPSASSFAGRIRRWPYHLVDEAMKSFLEYRRVSEIARDHANPSRFSIVRPRPSKRRSPRPSPRCRGGRPLGSEPGGHQPGCQARPRKARCSCRG